MILSNVNEKNRNAKITIIQKEHGNLPDFERSDILSMMNRGHSIFFLSRFSILYTIYIFFIHGLILSWLGYNLRAQMLSLASNLLKPSYLKSSKQETISQSLFLIQRTRAIFVSELFLSTNAEFVRMNTYIRIYLLKVPIAI